MGQEQPAAGQRCGGRLGHLHEPAGRCAMLSVCGGRFALKCKEREKIRAVPFKETDNKNLLEKEREVEQGLALCSISEMHF